MGTSWTDEQQQVIDARDRNILVSAAAGSGKTAVLVERILQMITHQEHPVNIDELLVVTFTKAAAAEMKERIGQALEKQKEAHPEDENLELQIALLGNAQITTIDSFCLNVIRNYFTEIDLDPSTRVADHTELELLKTDTMAKLLEEMYASGDEAFLNFADCYATGKTDAGIEALILKLYTESQSQPWPEKWLMDCLSKLEIGNEEDLADSEPIHYLMAYFRVIVQDLKDQLLYAKKICLLPDGPGAYEANIDELIVFVDDILARQDFKRMSEIFSAIPNTRLASQRGKTCTEEHKKLVADIKKSVKEKLEKFRDTYFYTDIAHMIQDIQMTRTPMQVLVQLVLEFSSRFQALKEEKHLMDFSDLEHFALQILVGEDEHGQMVRRRAAKELSAQFKEILCDEYQDSNAVQETLLTAVSRIEEGQPNIFMVGDVKQSIYKFRLARPELFMEKYETYTLAQSDYQRIDLSKNFRSRQCVVDFVNLIFEHIMGEKLGSINYDEKAALYYGANYPETQALHSTETEVLLLDVSEADEEDEELEDISDKEWEARMIGHRIHEMMDSGFQVYDRKLSDYRPLRYRDIAILLRATKDYGEAFVNTLADMGIPANSEVTSGFFDTYEIRTAVCLLNIIDNPLQDIELASVLKSCIGGFSDEDLAVIRTALKKAPLYLACRRFLNPESDVVSGACFDMAQIEEIRVRLQRFMDQLAHFRALASYMNIHELILTIWEETGYDYLVTAMPNGKQRHANLELFLEKAVAYERTSYKGLFNFVRFIRNLKTQQTDIGEVSVFGENENVVRIVTIHKSKGLEYPVVFVSGLAKQFNKMDTKASILTHMDYGFGAMAVDAEYRVKSPTLLRSVISKKMESENLSEELRVLYVALTRAREKLILTGILKDRKGNRRHKWQKAADTAGVQLCLDDLESASGYLDWIMPVLYNEDYRRASQAKIDIKILSKQNILWQQAAEVLGNHQKKMQLLEAVRSQSDPAAVERMQAIFDWQYPDQAVIQMPSKLSISEIKKMSQDQETRDSWEGRSELPEQLVTPGLDEAGVQETEKLQAAEADQASVEGLSMAERMARAAARGTAVHKLMELADFNALKSLQQVKDYIDHCTVIGAITEEMKDAINPWKIFNMVRSPLGQRMAKAQAEGKLYKEAQFIMSVDAREIYADTLTEAQKEIILTQGIIDVYFEEADGIVLMDYKTDYIRPEDKQQLIDRYAVQLKYYQEAIEGATHKKVKEKCIYAFAIDDIIVL